VLPVSQTSYTHALLFLTFSVVDLLDLFVVACHDVFLAAQSQVEPKSLIPRGIHQTTTAGATIRLKIRMSPLLKGTQAGSYAR
jgi:hypothetical protein